MESPTPNVVTSTLEVAGGPQVWIGKIAREWGIFAAMTVFFIWQSTVREGALTKRNHDLADFIQTTLVKTIENNTRAIEGFRTIVEHKQ